MYIFELITNFFNKKYNQDEYQKEDLSPYNTESFEPNTEEDYENCEHIFMPVDSTGEVLACTKCGLLKKLNELNFKEN